jgi:hypothetical protein
MVLFTRILTTDGSIRSAIAMNALSRSANGAVRAATCSVDIGGFAVTFCSGSAAEALRSATQPVTAATATMAATRTRTPPRRRRRGSLNIDNTSVFLSMGVYSKRDQMSRKFRFRFSFTKETIPDVPRRRPSPV